MDALGVTAADRPEFLTGPLAINPTKAVVTEHFHAAGPTGALSYSIVEPMTGSKTDNGLASHLSEATEDLTKLVMEE